MEMEIEIKTLEELKVMRMAGLLVAQTLELLRSSIRIGMRTNKLNTIAEANIKRGGGTSNFKGYNGFPSAICVSINEELVHGIPGNRVVEDGDIVSLDCGAIVDGWHSDATITVGVGKVDPADQKLIEVCEEAMWRGIAAGSNGAHLSDIGHAIEQYTKSQGEYGILEEYGGHGIGSQMHMDPHIRNFGEAGFGPVLVAGMALAIEPTLVRGSNQVHLLDDNWTVVSIDKSRGAHFEHSYAILPDGRPLVLTAIDGGLKRLGALEVEISTLLY